MTRKLVSRTAAATSKRGKVLRRARRELRQIGHELASAFLKGSYSRVPVNEVPLLTLATICENHEVVGLTLRELGTVARAMQEALVEAERWNG